MKGRRTVGSFFLVAGIGFLVLSGVLYAVGGAVAGIVGLTFLMIGGIWAAVGLGLGRFYGALAKKGRAEQALFGSGRRATAVVDSVETGSAVLNNVNQQIHLSLTVRPRNEPEFSYSRKMYVPFHGIPRTGDLIEVAYDPADKTRVALDTDWRSDTAGGRLLNLRRAQEAKAPATADETAPERVIEQLERLSRLKEEGALTEREFENQKAKVLASGGL